MCEYAASCDARALHIGSYSAWLTKVKGDGARAKWFNNNTTRYFTIDFDSQLFYYSHNEDRKKISSPVRFNEILHAEQLPRPAQVTPTKNSADNTYGFIVQTPGRTFELYTITYLDAKHWVDALIAARDIANRVTTSPPVGSDSSMALSQPVQAMSKPASASMAARELSRSSMSTTADGSDSGRSNSDREPLLMRSQGYGSSQPPPAYAPPSVRPPVAYSGYGSQPSAAPLPRAPLPASSTTAAAPAGGATDVDPFAALDALAELAGPLPDQPAPILPLGMNVTQQSAVAGEHLRQARQLVTQKGAGREAKRASAELRRQRDAAAGQPACAADALLGGAAYAAAAQPAASLAASHTQQHNASADNWDSDEDIALLQSTGPAAQQASPQRPAALRMSPAHAVAAAHTPLMAPLTDPLTAPLMAQAPAAPMSAAPGWPSQMQAAPLAAPNTGFAVSAASAAAVNNEAPWDSDDDTAAPRAAAGRAFVPEGPSSHQHAEASGWDSDDDHAGQRNSGARGAWGAAPAHAAVPLTQNPAAEASGWDSDDDATGRSRQARAVRPAHNAVSAAAPLAPAPLAPAPSAAAPRLDACGAPVRRAEAFVTAKKPVAATTSAGSLGDDLDDLVGEVLAADTTAPSRGATSGLVPGFHCTGCDFQVLRVEDYIWGGGVEYMFFRNNYPNVGKLRAQLLPQRGCCAYCCQCSWKSAESAAALADVAEGLRWRSLGF